jgi:hypothetical protein
MKKNQEFNQYGDDDEGEASDPESPEDLNVALKWHHKVLQRTKLLEKKYYGTSPIDESEQDPLMKQMSEEDRAKIIELRSETNRILKEEAEKEFNADCNRSMKRLADNYNQYVENRPDPLTCKSMEIFLNSKGSTLRNTITEGIDIISNSTVLKVVKLKWLWFEEREKNENHELYYSLVAALSKCLTLKKVILEDCLLDYERICSSLPSVEVTIASHKTNN